MLLKKPYFHYAICIDVIRMHYTILNIEINISLINDMRMVFDLRGLDILH